MCRSHLTRLRFRHSVFTNCRTLRSTGCLLRHNIHNKYSQLVQLVQTMKLGHTYTHGQHGNLVSLLTFLRKERGLNEDRKKNKKFWDELLAYFPSIRHGPQRKRRLQQSFVAGGPCLPSCYLPTIGRYTEKHTDRRFHIFFYCCVCIRCRGDVHAEPLPSNDRGIHM
jgi:hypothetical protein